MLGDLSLRRLRQSWRRSRRDAAMLARGLAGRHPPPLVHRPARGASGEPSAKLASRGARLVQVAEVVRETADAVSLWLELVSGEDWVFEPGQFLTLLVNLDGTVLRRAYSISSPARSAESTAAARVRITCKRVAEGRVSSFLTERVQAGDRLRVFGPSGSFVASAAPRNVAHLVLLGGGSGITPLMGIARAVLASSSPRRVSLIYGNRSADDVIFAKELAELATLHPERFRVRHVLETIGAVGMDAREGTLDELTLTAELDALLDGSTLAARYYLCGPQAMMAAARRALAARGVPGEHILEERFTSPGKPLRRLGSPMPQSVSVVLADGVRQVQVAPGQSLLDAALEADVPLRFSCAMGGCGACKVELRQGEVDMVEPNCLTVQERAERVILPCVAHPRERSVVEVLP